MTETRNHFLLTANDDRAHTLEFANREAAEAYAENWIAREPGAKIYIREAPGTVQDQLARIEALLKEAQTERDAQAYRSFEIALREAFAALGCDEVLEIVECMHEEIHEDEDDEDNDTVQ